MSSGSIPIRSTWPTSHHIVSSLAQYAESAIAPARPPRPPLPTRRQWPPAETPQALTVLEGTGDEQSH